MGGKPLLGAEGWVLSLTLLPADLRGNKKGSERLAAVCLPVSGVGGGVFPHLHPPSSPGLSWALTRTLKVPARPPPAACLVPFQGSLASGCRRAVGEIRTTGGSLFFPLDSGQDEEQS